MDLETICERISDIANDNTLKIGGTNYTRCKGWVREAYYLDILAQRTDWWFLRNTESVNTVAAQNYVELPENVDVKQIRNIQIAGYEPLEGMSEHDADNANVVLTTPGRPTSFWHNGYNTTSSKYKIQLYPVPDAIYVLNVRAMREPDDLEDDADVPSLPTIFQYLLVKGGYVRALKHNQDAGYENEMAEYLKQIARLTSWNSRDEYLTDSWWK